MPRTDNNITFVEDSRLAGGDAVRRLVEPQAEPLSGRFDICGDCRSPVAKLRVAARDGGEQAPGRGHVATRERCSRPDDDGVRCRIAAERESRLSRRDAEPTSLAGREAPEALMRADAFSTFVDDMTLASRQSVALEEVPVVAASEEARLLALGAARDRQPGERCLGTRLLLGLLPEREPDPIQVTRIEPGEHVRLILHRVGGA